MLGPVLILEGQVGEDVVVHRGVRKVTCRAKRKRNLVCFDVFCWENEIGMSEIMSHYESR